MGFKEIMEEQKITTTSSPRIVLKRTSVNKKLGWEISTSSSQDKEELKKMVGMLEEINKDMEEKFTKSKIKEGE